MNENPITCEFCASLNLAGQKRCLACGAPLPLPVTPPLRVTTVQTPSTPAVQPTTPFPENLQENQPVSQQLKDGLKAAGAGLGALGIGAFLMRTGSEALAIAFSAFLIGFVSASSTQFWLGIGGGILVGLAVGMVIKRSWLVLVSAPFGTLLGMLAAWLIRDYLPNLPWAPLLAILGAVLFALLGSHRRTTGAMRWYQRIRPVLGATGGFLFALLGYALGKLF